MLLSVVPQFILDFLLCYWDPLLIFAEEAPEIEKSILGLIFIINFYLIFLVFLLGVDVKHHIFGHLLVILDEFWVEIVSGDSNTKFYGHL